MKRARCEKELQKLQVGLCHLQAWVKEKGLRVVIVVEGRDGAGKGGRSAPSPSGSARASSGSWPCRRPSDREKSQVYIQRYLQHFPAAGEIVIFDRSWYNRAGVEYVMGFCTEKQHRRFLICPEIERYLIDGGIILIKFWLEVSNDVQKERFEARIEDPLRQWKLSPMDLPSRERWYDYSRARDKMLKETDTKIAPWHLVRSDDKRAARLNTIAHILSRFRTRNCRTKRSSCRRDRPRARTTTTKTIAAPQIHQRALLSRSAADTRVRQRVERLEEARRGRRHGGSGART